MTPADSNRLFRLTVRNRRWTWAERGGPPGAASAAGQADLLLGFFLGGFQEFSRDSPHRYIAGLDGTWVGLGAGVDLHVGGKLGLGPDDLTFGSEPSLNSGHVPKVPGREGCSRYARRCHRVVASTRGTRLAGGNGYARLYSWTAHMLLSGSSKKQ